MRKKIVAQIELVAEERKLKSEQSGPGDLPCQPNDCRRVRSIRVRTVPQKP